MKHAFSQLVEKACRQWEAQCWAAAAKQDPAPTISPAFTIAISREPGTEATSIANEVAKVLGWHVYDNELLERIAQDMGLRTNLLDCVDERRHNWFHQTAESFPFWPDKGDSGLATESGYIRHLKKVVYALGSHGDCVIVGRGAAFILPPGTTLRVRLVGAVPERIATLRRNLALPESEAARMIHALDRERTAFVQDHFRKDPNDPRNYDLVLNVPRLSPARSAQVIVDTFRGMRAAAGGT